MGMVGVGYHHPSVQWPHPPMDERQRGNSAAVASGLKLVTASLPVTSGQSDLGVSLPSFRFPSIRSLSCSLWLQVTRSWESPSVLVLFDAYFASSVACCTPFHVVSFATRVWSFLQVFLCCTLSSTGYLRSLGCFWPASAWCKADESWRLGESGAFWQLFVAVLSTWCGGKAYVLACACICGCCKIAEGLPPKKENRSLLR